MDLKSESLLSTSVKTQKHRNLLQKDTTSCGVRRRRDDGTLMCFSGDASSRPSPPPCSVSTDQSQRSVHHSSSRSVSHDQMSVRRFVRVWFIRIWAQVCGRSSRETTRHEEVRNGFVLWGLPTPAAAPWHSSGWWSSSPGTRTRSSSGTPTASSSSSRGTVAAIFSLRLTTCRTRTETGPGFS